MTELVGNPRDDGLGGRDTTASGAVLDHAVGVVMKLGRLAPEQAEQILRDLSRHTGIKVRHVAQLLVEWTRTGRLCADLRTELDRQLATHRASPRTGL
ncbi:ANTAR domain-containing protein [Streptomyces sp. NPDC048566]|uniref:ANTAR domain-containing protein n=1 Tax=Streptomyces sp. NPDC048566 TaxID=3365569 RepID=UPI00371ACB40